jgi:hypothetical protein
MKKKSILSTALWQLNPMSNCTLKINTLQLENKQERDQFIRLNDDHTKLKEYFFRQDLYKKKSLIN